MAHQLLCQPSTAAFILNVNVVFQQIQFTAGSDNHLREDFNDCCWYHFGTHSRDVGRLCAAEDCNHKEKDGYIYDTTHCAHLYHRITPKHFYLAL
jgi:hypothetical protein